MAGSIVLPQAQPLRPLRRLLETAPGIALLGAIGFGGKFLEQTITVYSKTHHVALPNIEYVLWAILFGLFISNIVGVAEIFKPGIATYDFWLKAGIVLLGVRFLVGDVLKLGVVTFGLVVVEITLSLTLMTALGKLFKLSPKLTTLLAVGSSICGVAAIIAAKGAIDADDEDSSFAIAAILALGALALFTFPLIGHALGMSDQLFGLWSGLAVDNTAEAVATGALYSSVAGRLAILAKTTRNAMIGFVVLAYATYWASQGKARSVENKASFLWQKFPKFVLGFLLISLLASINFFSNDQTGAIANLSRWAFLLAFAGVGLKTNFREMRKQGLRPFIVGALGEVAIAVLTLGMVLGANKLFHL